MGHPITNITIIGGGTAGWIAAAYLNHRLQWGDTAQPGVRVTLIESPSIPTIGVGEATVPTLKGTLRLLEIAEDEFVARTAATMKLGIRFDAWQAPAADGTPHSYLSPFTASPPVAGHGPGASFTTFEAAAQDTAQAGSAFYETTNPVGAAVGGLKGPRGIDGAEFTGPLQYAYHVDAGLFADFLKEVCIARGVEHIRDDVTGIVRDERGLIASLTLASRGAWPTELVIDCTGFRGLIINDYLGEPFDGLGDYLFNDRAIPIQVERVDQTTILPATVARAMEAGWSWRIPLHSRDGTGYVYSSAFTSDDAAMGELDRLLGPGARLTEPRRIAMRVGRSRRSWVGNCVAIGASSGFLEPLESTTILGIELASRWLLRNFPTTDFEAPLAARFNREMNFFYDEVRDFIGLHFVLSDRDDTPYWRAVRNDARRSDALTENLDVWRHRLPTREDVHAGTVFGHKAIEGVLIGKGFYTRAPAGGMAAVPPDVWQRHKRDIVLRKHALTAALPGHWDLLQAIRARSVPGVSAARRPAGLGNVDAIVNDTLLLRE